MPKNAKKFYCEKCDFTCSKSSNLNKHKMTLKHSNGDKMVTNGDNNMPKNATYECKCGNTYMYRQGLSRHRQNCSVDQVENNDKNSNNISGFEIDKELLIKLLLKNQDVMEKMMEIMPQIGNNSHNTNSHNTTNNQFNIHMFLNEHCKNAMNLTDFIDSLPITSETYDSTIENGLTKTITNLLVNGLSQLDILDRPIHCTDATRKTLYVKNDNIWEKDNELLHVIKGIKTLSMKQRTMINKWQDANMGWDTKENLQSRMTKLVFNSMTSIENDDKETGKIIRALSKNVYLDTDTKGKYIQLE
jgi:hypothetical protein